MRKRRAVRLPSKSRDHVDEPPLKKVPEKIKNKKVNQTSANNNESSSDSDIENYLQSPEKIDFNSSFFNLKSASGPLIESDDASDFEEVFTNPEPSTSRKSFEQLQDYHKKIEEARKHVEKYNAKKRADQNQVNVSSLLAVGESKLIEDKHTLEPLETSLNSSDFDTDSNSDEAWEEVENREEPLVPRESVQITVEMPNAVKKKKVDFIAMVKRRINRAKKMTQILVHKVHLLCWIAHGNYINTVINSENILAAALSILPSEQCRSVKRADLNYIENLLKWYRSVITLTQKHPLKNRSFKKLLEIQISRREAVSDKMLVYIFIAILRSLGYECRLVLSLQVEPLRPPQNQLFSLSQKNNSPKPKEETVPNKNNETNKQLVVKMTKCDFKQTKGRNKTRRSQSTRDTSKIVTETGIKTRSKSINEGTINSDRLRDVEKTKQPKVETGMKLRSRDVKYEDNKKEGARKNGPKNASEVKKKKISKGRVKEDKKNKSKSNLVSSDFQKSNKIKIRLGPKSKSKSKSQNPSIIPQLDGLWDSSVNETLNNNVTVRKKGKQDSSNQIFNRPNTRSRMKNDLSIRIPFSPKNQSSPQQHTSKTVPDLIRKGKSSRESDNDSDYMPEAPEKKYLKLDQMVYKKNASKHGNVDIWAEIFLESEKKWISVDVVGSQINCASDLYSRATGPVSYILAWNNRNSLKDVSSRYCPHFNTTTRKLRVGRKWWESTLKPFSESSSKDLEEDRELEQLQLEKPLPKTLKEYKNHPLYVLKRHLLKYEAIYPPDTATLGFVRGEAVYPRQCVFILHPRDVWLKQAKVVKLGEKAYKIVKGRPRWDKWAHKIVTDPEMDIFGPWQVQDYEPPTAENGIVPRNAYGNVELYKPSMLPKKTVHLRLPGLHKIAKRMNIDCAPAFTGFDYYGGWIHPSFDGVVVCEEYADILVAAWELEQDDLDKKEEEKIERRVYGNWKKLIKGLLIRERLKAKYKFGEMSQSGVKKKGPKFATKKRYTR